jgi:hypothetical protein
MTHNTRIIERMSGIVLLKGPMSVLPLKDDKVRINERKYVVNSTVYDFQTVKRRAVPDTAELTINIFVTSVDA